MISNEKTAHIVETKSLLGSAVFLLLAYKKLYNKEKNLLKKKGVLKMENTRERKLATNIMDVVNEIGFDDKEFAMWMCRQHRTLQQSAFRAFLAWTRELAAMENYDARNEASVLLARELVKTMDEIGDSLPMI